MLHLTYENARLVTTDVTRLACIMRVLRLYGRCRPQFVPKKIRLSSPARRAGCLPVLLRSQIYCVCDLVGGADSRPKAKSMVRCLGHLLDRSTIRATLCKDGFGISARSLPLPRRGKSTSMMSGYFCAYSRTVSNRSSAHQSVDGCSKFAGGSSGVHSPGSIRPDSSFMLRQMGKMTPFAQDQDVTGRQRKIHRHALCIQGHVMFVPVQPPTQRRIGRVEGLISVIPAGDPDAARHGGHFAGLRYLLPNASVGLLECQLIGRNFRRKHSLPGQPFLNSLNFIAVKLLITVETSVFAHSESPRKSRSSCASSGPCTRIAVRNSVCSQSTPRTSGRRRPRFRRAFRPLPSGSTRTPAIRS